MSEYNIDFVVLWVDGEDAEWQKEFNCYSDHCEGDKRKSRYRDWETLKYLFRSFEQYTPWVRKIHFVTYGHLPGWLNINHPKLQIVRHSDFLNEKNLPVFNSHPIELNLHRIQGLSDHFVYFNDDTFILKPVTTERFFRNKLPRDMLAFTSILMTHLSHIRLNDLLIINKHFEKKDVLKKHFFRWFNFQYGLHLLKSLFLLPWPQITGIVDPHQPQPFLKSTFYDLWQKEFDVLAETSKSKFRKDSDVNQYLFRYWQLLKGQFEPVSFKDSLCIQIECIADAELAAKKMLQNKYSLFCINDLFEDHKDFEKAKLIINAAFETLFPDKSGFEK